MKKKSSTKLVQDSGPDEEQGEYGQGDDDDDLPEGWERIHDDEQDIDYYYNTLNGDSVWEKPTEPARV